jgi:putative redox protein
MTMRRQRHVVVGPSRLVTIKTGHGQQIVSPSRSVRWSSRRAAVCDDDDDNNKNSNNDGEEQGHTTNKVYRLQGETMAGNKSGVTITTTDTGHVLQTDLPRKMGGQDTAPQPVETLLAAWMGCTQATALFVGRQMKLPDRLLLDRLVFDVKGVRDERGALSFPMEQDPPVPSRLLQVHGRITVYQAGGMPISPDKLELLQEQTEKRCPIANMMIASGCLMNVAWVDGACSNVQETDA